MLHQPRLPLDVLAAHSQNPVRRAITSLPAFVALFIRTVEMLTTWIVALAIWHFGDIAHK
jgi:hypothetical protein